MELDHLGASSRRWRASRTRGVAYHEEGRGECVVAEGHDEGKAIAVTVTVTETPIVQCGDSGHCTDRNSHSDGDQSLVCNGGPEGGRGGQSKKGRHPLLAGTHNT